VTLVEQAQRFGNVLAEARGRVCLLNETWYPYDSLANVVSIEDLLRRANLSFAEVAGGQPVADIGCADGDLAFFLASLGCDVDAIDNPDTNQNLMAGVHVLSSMLGFAVRPTAINLDYRFELPRRYGLAIVFGILYHLKNPMALLESLAYSARYCLLSTRVADRAPGGAGFAELPVAWLLGASEINDDPTNYWIFSEAGLRRLVERCGWRVVAWTRAGAAVADPVEADARVFCLLESTRLPAEYGLLDGWHELEYKSWRWTRQRFAVSTRGPRRSLRFRYSVPSAWLARVGASELRIAVNGAPLAAEPITAAGEFEVTRPLPAAESLTIEFELTRAVAAGEIEQRELGLLVKWDSGEPFEFE
jgi:hypothetical protein